MVTDMGMTNKQFQGFIRLALSVINEALKITPDNEKLLELKDIVFPSPFGAYILKCTRKDVAKAIASVSVPFRGLYS